MPAPSDDTNLLRVLYDVGEELRTALDENELDRFAELVERRAGLVEQLRSYDHPSELDADWHTLAQALRHQHEELQETLSEKETELEDAVQHVERLKAAQRSYNASPPRESGVLNQNLQG